jgi:hypothetical protein
MAEPRTVHSHVAIQGLYETAKQFVDGSGSLEHLKDAVAAVDAAADENDSDEMAKIVEIARKTYVDSSCDVDIDNSMLHHHNGNNGYWVGAWLWVSDEQASRSEEEDDDDATDD